MTNQITASRLLADDGDIMTLEGLLKQSRISDGRVEDLYIEVYAEDVYFGNDPPQDCLQQYGLLLKPPGSKKAEKNTQNARVQAQIELNKQRLSAYDYIFGALAFSPRKSIDLQPKQMLQQNCEHNEAFEDIESDVRYGLAPRQYRTSDAELEAEKSHRLEKQPVYYNLAEKPECVAPAEEVIQISLATRKKPAEIIPPTAESAVSEQQAPGVVLSRQRVPARQIAAEKVPQTRDSKLPRRSAYAQTQAEDEDFEPLASSVAGSRLLQSTQRRKAEVERRQRDITKNVFSELYKTVYLGEAVAEKYRAARKRSTRPKTPERNRQVLDSQARGRTNASAMAHSGQALQIHRSLSATSGTNHNDWSQLKASAVSARGGSRYAAASKSARKEPQKCASVQPQRKKWYPTPESDIYARSQQRRLQFERKLQKLREECAPREEEFSFTPTISFKGKHYKYVPETSRFRVSRTLQEYLQQKRQQFTFRPQITAAPPSASRGLGGSQSFSQTVARRGTAQEFTFRPQINSNYYIKTPRTGDAGQRQYSDYMQRMSDYKNIRVAQPADKLTKSQLQQFFQRYNEFLARKQRLLHEFELAEAQKCTFQPEINTPKAAAACDKTRKPESACGYKQSQTREDTQKQQFTPRIDKYSQKIVQYSGRKPIEQTSIQSFRERQIRLRQNERARMLQEFKDEHVGQTEERRQRSAQLAGHALIGDKCW